MIDPLIRLSSSAISGRRHQVLHFHRVLARPDPMLPGDPDRPAFERLLGCLKRAFTIIPLDDAIRRLRDGRLPTASMSLTFDDGYADNFTNALPVLRAQGLTATFFISTGHLNGGRMWNDTVIETIRRMSPGRLDLSRFDLEDVQIGDSPAGRGAAAIALVHAVKHLPPEKRAEVVDWLAEQGAGLPTDLMLTDEQVRGLAAAGMGIGAHTVSHPILSRLDGDSARRELVQGKHDLEGILGRPVPLFAYPNGKFGRDYDDRHADMARDAGYEAAMSTDAGVAGPGSDLFKLPRFTPWDRTCGRYKLRLLMNRFGLIR